ncbi:HD-domain/PDEase-like protein [Xylona heveae TC161]|uniref:Phosphodiesterase n=1 Tax=Xylona heveae (strain CBS 132557 / TC161) TaxID=1328760 RepID=A0A165IMN2_XYLHT|nr:HD-domain/PDEase-like protein [Xylona heveae TC161]KZF25115.1 HD-domain/PDEase-like protein [Xylona heveae TC161]
MDYAACNVIYIDKRVRHDRPLTRSHSSAAGASSSSGAGDVDLSTEHETVQINLRILLSIFHQVHICKTGHACVEKVGEIEELQASELRPTLVFLDMPLDDYSQHHVGEGRSKLWKASSPPGSPRSQRPQDPENMAPPLYGPVLLQQLTSHILSFGWSKLVVPIAMVDLGDQQGASGTSDVGPHSASPHEKPATIAHDKMLQCLETGAVDVISSPFSKDRIAALAVHAYRVHKELSKQQTGFLPTRRGRKRSWVGVDEEKPYAYLREAMVSGLMDGICKPVEIEDRYDHDEISISPERLKAVAKAVGTWDFSPHEFTDDELVYGALLMLQHALEMPGLEKFRMSAEDLLAFLVASRSAYNSFVLYHNFRHVIDVLQAVFFFLLQIGTIPPFQGRPVQPTAKISPIGSLIQPFDALTLLISAIGHDVGHPGVNNAFLITLNAPLAQLYNDRSVLESFHCAAYSQILRRYWPAAFQDTNMRKLLINCILATDMGVHFQYMKDVGNLQEKLAENKGTDGWSPKVLEEYKALACGLLIKCADISNVARKFSTAAEWAYILTGEFARQCTMEQELQIPTALFGGPPVQDSIVKLGESQLGFMNIFAYPLFEAVANILPAMQFSVDEIVANKVIWETTIAQEREKLKEKGLEGGEEETSPARPSDFDGTFSPRSGSSPDLTKVQENMANEHPPKSTSQSPMSSSMLSISKGDPEAASRSSLSAVGALKGTPSHSHAASRRSSLGSPGFATPASNLASRRSSGAFKSISPPSVQTGGSYKPRVPSELQLGDEKPSAEASQRPAGVEQQSSSNRVPATAPENDTTRPNGALIGPAAAAAADVDLVENPYRPSQHHPSGRNNDESNNRFSTSSSQAARGGWSPGPGSSGVSPSPGTQATSVASGDAASHTAQSNRCSSPPLSSLHENADHQQRPPPPPKEEKNNIVTSISGAPKTIRRRTSRFRLDFWRKKSSKSRSQSKEACPRD